MRGKDKCNLLKSIRCKIAYENGIDYRPTECSFQGECKGTCPKCEAELRELSAQLERLKKGGKRVAVAGVAAALVAGCASGCVPRPDPQTESTVHMTLTDPAENPNDYALDGDVAFPEDTDVSEGKTDVIDTPEEDTPEWIGEVIAPEDAEGEPQK